MPRPSRDSSCGGRNVLGDAKLGGFPASHRNEHSVPVEIRSSFKGKPLSESFEDG